jgi:type I restriction enzyme M protein
MPDTPEQAARRQIDALLTLSGWTVQTKDSVNLAAARGVAICELSFKTGEPDYTLFADGNVLFEGGAGETIRRELLKQADVHTLLRLTTGIFYAQGVKANVLFFDRKPAQEKPWTERLWIYDLRTNKHFTLKESTLKRSDLDDFVACYFGQSGSGVPPLNQATKRSRDGSPTLSRHKRKESGRFKSFTYDELLKRDKVNLDIFWLKDEALEESANLPDPDVIAADIAADLEAALEQFATIAEDLKGA